MVKEVLQILWQLIMFFALIIGDTVDILNHIKMKNCSSSKDKFKRMKRQSREWEKLFATHLSDK